MAVLGANESLPRWAQAMAIVAVLGLLGYVARSAENGMTLMRQTQSDLIKVAAEMGVRLDHLEIADLRHEGEIRELRDALMPKRPSK